MISAGYRKGGGGHYSITRGDEVIFLIGKIIYFISYMYLQNLIFSQSAPSNIFISLSLSFVCLQSWIPKYVQAYYLSGG